MEGLSSLLGLAMAASSCPVMTFFKPMVHFHKPFSTTEETTVRTASTYLLRKFFANKNGEILNSDLTELRDIYESLKILNLALHSRIKDCGVKESSINALIRFYYLVELVLLAINSNLGSIQHLFE